METIKTTVFFSISGSGVWAEDLVSRLAMGRIGDIMLLIRVIK